MTRASEFCYILEARNGEFLQTVKLAERSKPCIWTKDPEMAMRLTFNGFHSMRKQLGGVVAGARKMLTE